MRIIVVGPGRAGGALALALVRAGHVIVAVVGRRRAPVEALAGAMGAAALEMDAELPAADLLVVAVRDDAVAEVAGRLAGRAGAVPAAVHLSGLVGVDALRPLAGAGLATGSLHPLQTLPDAEQGAAALPGSAVAITASGALAGVLEELAASIGCVPFRLDDAVRPLYHAAAAAAANYVITSLALAERLFGAASVDLTFARPLVEAVVENAFAMGPRSALTGPIARGDVGTVAAQLEAIRRTVPEVERDFKAMGRATARLAGTAALFSEVLDEVPR